MSKLKPFIQWSHTGKASEGIFHNVKCLNHRTKTDEYGERHPCSECKTTDGYQRWWEWIRRPEFDAPVVPDVNEQLSLNV